MPFCIDRTQSHNTNNNKCLAVFVPSEWRHGLSCNPDVNLSSCSGCLFATRTKSQRAFTTVLYVGHFGSQRFNEIKNGKKKEKSLCWFIIDFLFFRLAKTAVSGSQSRDFLGSDVILGSLCGCHLRLFIECVCVWSTKALTMPAYCVAANCNNSQATQSITVHEFSRNRPAVKRKWVKSVQFKRADFDAAPQSHPFV